MEPPPPPVPHRSGSTSNVAPSHQSVNVGRGVEGGTDNAVYTTKYNLITFLPLAISEQFRRVGNVYFLCIGILMFIGQTYPKLFPTSANATTMFLPLALIISLSIFLEGSADLKRRTSDIKTNSHPCVVLRRTEDMDPGDVKVKDIMDGCDVDVRLLTQLSPKRARKTISRIDDSEQTANIAFVSKKREDILAGDIVIVRNRDMIPADLVLLGSSGENGCAYVETSQIDGETNLKLRTSPALPVGSVAVSTPNGLGNANNYEHPKLESLLQAVKRVTRMSLLGFPDAESVLKNPHNESLDDGNSFSPPSARSSFLRTLSLSVFSIKEKEVEVQITGVTKFVATLTSELPNASVNTFSGKLTTPPLEAGLPGINIPLDAENFLLRGAALRNTEWVIGVACFTGSDTKLVMNSTKTPSKLSRLDILLNQLVIRLLVFMLTISLVLGIMSSSKQNKDFDTFWYIGLNKNETDPWQYLTDFEAPEWNDTVLNPFQNMLTYITLLSNFVPLSLYITVEVTTKFMMLLISWDKHMYHKETDTRAAARSTIVSDLGLVEYIFSDKTGTLTQNVMQFKRCSVNGMMFGNPVVKSAPSDIGNQTEVEALADQEFHPLNKLLEGVIRKVSSLEAESSQPNMKTIAGPEPLTFNAEMFLRVMSICHTVVVEKEMVSSDIGAADGSKDGGDTPFWKRKRKQPGDADNSNLLRIAESVSNEQSNDDLSDDDEHLNNPTQPDDIQRSTTNLKGSSGAPEGYTYQAESPDEDALVSAASLLYGFQLKSRDINGLTISCEHPSLLSNKSIANELKSGTTTAKQLAWKTSSLVEDGSYNAPGEETWAILAINKFDSTRKRMSVVVRSPPELGSIPMLLCKGADSAMLDPNVCGTIDFGNNEGLQLSSTSMSKENANLLGIQSHLGAFASEGLRTLVLGVRILSERDCVEWLKKFKKASSSLLDRDSAMTALAANIERNIHIVGSTAIEDKLQDGVPEAIDNIGKSGIKLWVLTGDKRETAIEIGYSTKVLQPTMNLTDISDGPSLKVRALVAMEFMRLVKMGKLSLYQNVALQNQTESPISRMLKKVGRFFRSSSRVCRRFYHRYLRSLCGTCNKAQSEKMYQIISDEEAAEMDSCLVRQRVRSLAEKHIAEYLQSPEGIKEKNRRSSVQSGCSSRSPNRMSKVFIRACSAMNLSKMNLLDQKEELRRSSCHSVCTPSSGDANRTLDELPQDVIDEETLSSQSLAPGTTGEYESNFDKKKRTLLERLFATDRDVRNGVLVKHLSVSTPEKLENQVQQGMHEDQRRALVIEGSALTHFLGDPYSEEILFAVASCCESVIACRVSPKQKALLVRMVHKFVEPMPVTLAIGDGANDVGMIQEAQIGIGISGLEGTQAVNASDFSIAQFRYLEELLLVHGRWNFIRLCKVVLLSFYKNALLASLIILFSTKSEYSGTLMVDQWLGSSFNFTSSFAVLFLGFFDRDVNREYMKKNPHLYASGPRNEPLCLRMTLRWLLIFLVQAIINFNVNHTILGDVGAGVSSAFKGLMSNKSIHGDGEGGDLRVYGTVPYVGLVFIVTGKVLFESSTIIHGVWPALTCWRGECGECWNRVAYTWQGVIFLSIGFTFAVVYVFQYLFKVELFSSMLGTFTLVTWHMFHTRALSWMVLFFAPITVIIIDVVLKVFSNMFYPTQTQIHKEIQWKDRQRH